MHTHTVRVLVLENKNMEKKESLLLSADLFDGNNAEKDPGA